MLCKSVKGFDLYRAESRTVLTILVLFLISLFPEIVTLVYSLELRSLLLAVFICFLIIEKCIQQFSHKKTKLLIFKSIDATYFVCLGLTVFSFFFMSQNEKAFHFVFVAFNMFCVFLFIRIEKFNNSITDIFKKKLLVQSIIFIAFINAIIGICQFICGKEIIGTFGYSSFFGCFLAMNVPIAFGLVLANWKSKDLNYKLFVISYRVLKSFSLLTLVTIMGVVFLTKSRSAIIGLGVVLPLMLIRFKGWKIGRLKSKHSPKFPFKRGLLKFAMIFIFAILVCFCGKSLYKLKPMSAIGRTLIWRVSAEMFFKNPVSGVGFGNLANSYNFYQADYFASGKGLIANKMTAGQIRHAYNWYLETAAEFGIFGLVVFGIFWWLVLAEVYKVFVPLHTKNINTDYGLRTTDYVNLGMAGSVLCFMIMCLFQFPNKIIPTYLIFNFALAWIVNANLKKTTKNQIINNK